MRIATAEYATALMGDEDIETAVPVGVEVSNGTTLRSTAFTHIVEARGLTWSDSFYDGKDSIVAVFDRDWEPVRRYYRVGQLTLSSLLLCFTGLTFAAYGGVFSEGWNDYLTSVGPFMMVYAGMFLLVQVRMEATLKQQHVAISTEGLRMDNNVGLSVTIPFEQILDCKASPQQHWFCCDAGFTTVSVVRKTSPMEGGLFCRSSQSTLVLYGIENADGLVRLLMSMKEATAASEGSVAAVPALTMDAMEVDSKQIV